MQSLHLFVLDCSLTLFTRSFIFTVIGTQYTEYKPGWCVHGEMTPKYSHQHGWCMQVSYLLVTMGSSICLLHDWHATPAPSLMHLKLDNCKLKTTLLLCHIHEFTWQSSNMYHEEQYLGSRHRCIHFKYSSYHWCTLVWRTTFDRLYELQLFNSTRADQLSIASCRFLAFWNTSEDCIHTSALYLQTCLVKSFELRKGFIAEAHDEKSPSKTTRDRHDIACCKAGRAHAPNPP